MSKAFHKKRKISTTASHCQDFCVLSSNFIFYWIDTIVLYGSVFLLMAIYIILKLSLFKKMLQCTFTHKALIAKFLFLFFTFHRFPVADLG